VVVLFDVTAGLVVVVVVVQSFQPVVEAALEVVGATDLVVVGATDLVVVEAR
jgi:hypothetical protein